MDRFKWRIKEKTKKRGAASQKYEAYATQLTFMKNPYLSNICSVNDLLLIWFSHSFYEIATMIIPIYRCGYLVSEKLSNLKLLK
jgi:hypothetical protein